MLIIRGYSNQATKQYNNHVETDFKVDIPITLLPWKPKSSPSNTPNQTSQKLTSTPSTRPPSSRSKAHLSSGAKAGIITACIIVFILLCLLLLELTYFGRQRRLTRARRQANAGGDVELDAEMSNKENAVLESRVEIVVEGETGETGAARETRETREKDARGTREHEEEDEDDDSDGDEWGGGRNTRTGMSLSRREG
ncbi:hypothetical protein COCMIDRAFT_2824 [Bipolaris oryzae ATCC 44560]|uniref:Uncharacterized protein n=1 Tax=Bipolaris oryzae ATCC 44560 TaxID=930090 RepID=W6ZL27_COCMI|nr:uncharacterized protein COCMIDRAFT_2824 [Bipolaris oryzae ATCC 44560]EUC48204.1 hypothetical protein COCMIDRAFT_2824 [Bipolaris oryzae ATCC 44560]